MSPVETPREHRADRAVDRRRVSLVLLWLALVSSFLYSTPKQAGSIGHEGLPADAIVRGVLPGILVLGALWCYRRFSFRPNAVQALFLAFALYACLSTAWSIAPLTTLFKAGQYLTCVVAVYLLARVYGTLEAAARALCMLVHALLIWVVIEVIAFPQYTFVMEGEYEDHRRLQLVVPEMAPNPLAWLCVAGIAGLALNVGPTWTRSRWIKLLLFLIYLGELLATRTRSAIALAVIVGLVVLVVQYRRHLRWVFVLGTVLVLTVAITLASPWGAGLTDFLLRGQTFSSLGSLTGRSTIWDIAIKTWAERPVLGLGYYAGHRLGVPGLPETQSNLDSTWIEVLVDLGVVGAVSLLGVVALGMWNLATSPRTRVQLWSLMTAGYGVVVSFLNPTLQSPGLGFVLLSVLIISADSRSFPWRDLPHQAFRSKTIDQDRP